MKTIRKGMLSLLALLCISGCTKKITPVMEVKRLDHNLIVSIIPNDEEGYHEYAVTLTDQNSGEQIAELRGESGEEIYLRCTDHVLWYMQNSNLTDLTVQVKAQLLGSFNAVKDEIVLNDFFPSDNPMTIGEDIAIHDIHSFRYSGSGSEPSDFFFYDLQPEEDGYLYETEYFYEDEHYQFTAHITDEEADAVFSILNGAVWERTYIEDPMLMILDGSSSEAVISYEGISEMEEAFYSLRFSREQRNALRELLHQTALAHQ